MGKVNFKPGNMLYPVPVVMVSCQGTAGGSESCVDNILTIAWTGTVCSDPPMLSIAVRPSRFSHGLIESSGEFVVNLVNEALVRAADFCGVKSGRDLDKWESCGLHKCAVQGVAAPGIAESPVNIGCRVREIKHLGSHDLFLAEVISVQADDTYLNEQGRFQLEKANLVCYSHGDYLKTGKKLGSFGFSVRKRKKK